MEPFAYRENLQSILAYTGGRHMIGRNEALAYLGFKNPAALYRRCPHFKNGKVSAETFAKSLSGIPKKS